MRASLWAAAPSAERMAAAARRGLNQLLPDLNRTLSDMPTRLIITVATHEYLPLTRNLLCSILQWWNAAVAVGVLVAGADAWLCTDLHPWHASVACVDPPTPHLAASPFEVYGLKLRLAARAALLGHEVFMADGATVLFANPFTSLPEPPRSALLLLSFQDKTCLDLLACETRTSPTPSPDHASTIVFYVAAEAAAAALVDRAASLLGEDGTLYGDQEALREVLHRHRQGAAPRDTADPRVPRPLWGFLPFPAFVRSMSWHHRHGVAGHDDADLFGRAVRSSRRWPAVYAAGMTQRGLAAGERVAVKRGALQRSGLWLVRGEGGSDAGVDDAHADAADAADAHFAACDGSWRRRPFSRDPWRSPAPPEPRGAGTGASGAASAADLADLAERLSSFSIAPASLSVETIRHLYTQAALWLQQPAGTAPRAWWHAALLVRALEALLREHLTTSAVPSASAGVATSAVPSASAGDGHDDGAGATLLSQHVRLYRATSPKELWEIGERAQQSAVTARGQTERGVMAVRVAVELACHGWLARLQSSAGAAAAVAGVADAVEELHATLALVSKQGRGHDEL